MLNTKKRINYLDAIKGFAMVMVVYGHVLGFVLDLKIRSSVIGEFITTFHVPLFFFVSGLLAYKPMREWNGKNTVNRTKDKFLFIMLPTLIFMTVYHLVTDGDIGTLVQKGPSRYWFTYTLFLFFATYYVIAYLCARIKCGYAEVISFILGLLFMGILIALKPQGSPLHNWLQSENYCNWFEFFALALVCRRYEDRFKSAINNDWFRAIVIAIFFITFVFHRLYVNSVIDKLLVFFVLRYCGVMMVFLYFYKNCDFFNIGTKVGNAFLYIGRRTLDVYLLHYFFLCDLSILGPFFENNAHPIIELVFCLSLSLLIVGATLILSNLLRTSDLLAHIFLGVKPKN